MSGFVWRCKINDHWEEQGKEHYKLNSTSERIKKNE
jgi:hypothetical protein